MAWSGIYTDNLFCIFIFLYIQIYWYLDLNRSTPSTTALSVSQFKKLPSAPKHTAGQRKEILKLNLLKTKCTYQESRNFKNTTSGQFSTKNNKYKTEIQWFHLLRWRCCGSAIKKHSKHMKFHVFFFFFFFHLRGLINARGGHCPKDLWDCSLPPENILNYIK